MAIFQDDKAEIHPAQIVKEFVVREHESFSHMNWPDFKFIESLWDVLEETLQSTGLLHWQYKILNVISIKRCIDFWSR